MARFVEYEPDRGIATYEDYTVDGRLQVHYRQDVEPILETAKTERINGLSDTKHAKQSDMRLYARIPPVIVLEMRYKHGVDIFNKDHLPKAVQLINLEYPSLKTTDLTHRLKN